MRGPDASGLRAQGITKTFTSRHRRPTTALEDISLDVKRGEFVAIVGPSGCGKTTLLRILAGMTAPTRGAVTLDGAVVQEPRADVAIMFQTPTLLPWRKVIDNCLLPLELKGRVSGSHRERAMALLSRAGLDGFQDRYPHELSGGMQQRVAICRSLVANPSVLLLDEPFGALDAMTRDQMNLDLREIWSLHEATTVLITHSIGEAVFLAQRVAIMSTGPGRIVEIVDVSLPSQRDIAVMESEEFARICANVRAYLNQGGRRADQQR